MSMIDIGFRHGKLVEPKIDFKFELDGVYDLSYILLNSSDEGFVNFINDKFEKIIIEKKEQSYGHATNEICSYNTAILNVMFEAKTFKDSLVDNLCVEKAYKQVRNEAYESLLKLLVLHHKIYDVNVKKYNSFDPAKTIHVFADVDKQDNFAPHAPNYENFQKQIIPEDEWMA